MTIADRHECEYEILPPQTNHRKNRRCGMSLFNHIPATHGNVRIETEYPWKLCYINETQLVFLLMQAVMVACVTDHALYGSACQSCCSNKKCCTREIAFVLSWAVLSFLEGYFELVCNGLNFHMQSLWNRKSQIRSVETKNPVKFTALQITVPVLHK